MSPLQQKLLCAYSLLHTAAVSLALGPTPQTVVRSQDLRRRSVFTSFQEEERVTPCIRTLRCLNNVPQTGWL